MGKKFVFGNNICSKVAISNAFYATELGGWTVVFRIVMFSKKQNFLTHERGLESRLFISNYFGIYSLI